MLLGRAEAVASSAPPRPISSAPSARATERARRSSCLGRRSSRDT